MKKLYSLILGLAMAATGLSLSAATGNLYITFNGTDNVGWKADGMTVANGVMHVDMPVSGDKARADLKFSDPSNPITINAETDKYLAIKFVGTRPAGNMTLEFKANGVWYNNKSNSSAWVNRPNGTIDLRGGNTIYYYDLTKDETYMVTEGDLGISDCNIKIADCTAEPYAYTIDWMGTFASVDDIGAWAYTADEGADDCEVPVVNQTTGVGYENIQPAISAAVNNDLLMVNSEVTFTSRTIVNDKSLSFKARTPGVVIKRDFNNNQQFTFGSEQNNRSFTFDGFTIDGNNKECCYFMNFKKGTQKFINCHFVNCKVKNTVSSQGNNGGILNIADVAAVELYNTTFGENTLLDDRTPVNICSSKGLTIGGDMTGVSVKFFNNGTDNVINYVEMEGETSAVVNVIYATTNLGAEVVKGCTDPSKFNYTSPKYELVPAGSNLKIARSVYFVGYQTNNWDINSSVKMTTADGEYYTLGIADGISGEWVLCDGSWDWKYAAGSWGVSSWNTKSDMWVRSNKNCDVTTPGQTYIVFKYNANESESSKVLVVARSIHFVGAQTGENGWNTSDPDYQFSTDNGLVYTLNIPDGITGDWKICDGTWDWNYGKANGDDAEINLGSVYNLTCSDDNFHRTTKGNTTIIYNMWDNTLRVESLITIGWDNSEHNWETPRVHYTLDGENYFVKEMTKWHAESESASQTILRRLRSLESDAWIAEIPENTLSMTFSGDGVNTISHSYTADKIDHQMIYDGNGNVTGVEAVEATEPVDLPVEYYNLQGQRVLNPANGIFIRRQGTKVEKVML